MSSQIKLLKAEYKRKKKREGLEIASNVESCFHRQMKESNLNPQIIKQARKTGILNLSGRGIREMPDVVWNINSLTEEELKSLSCSLDNRGETNWWDFVDLTKLILASNSLHSISSQIQNYQALSVFDVHDNCLTSLPDEVEDLENLQKLDISRNRFELLPSCVYKLKGLHCLLAHHNQIEILDESVANLTVLEELDISYNCLKELPHSLGFLTHVSALNVANNFLTSVPLEIGDLCGLRTLDLSNNVIEKLPAQIENLCRLEVLYLQHNQLQSPPSLPKSSTLKEVHCGFNKIRELSAELFDGLSGIKLLDFRDNQIEEINSDVSLLQTLETLYLSNNNLSSLPFSLGTLPHLKILTLEGNSLKAIRRDVLQRGTTHILKWLSSRIEEPVTASSTVFSGECNCATSTLQKCNVCSVDRNALYSTKAVNLSNRGLACVPDSVIESCVDARVTTVDLSKNSLTCLNESLQALLPNVTELNLAINKLECIPSFISVAVSLQYLNISANKLEELPCEMKELVNMKEINMSFNRFQKLPLVLYELRKLEIVIASDNHVTEIDVHGLSKLAQLAVLDLHNNDIAFVPPELGTLTCLRSLSLNGNRFRHPRPAILSKGASELLKYLRNQIRCDHAP